MKKEIFLTILFLFAFSCQGPWSYWPENPENYRGIWVSAYVVSGRPFSDICFEKLHNLDEVRMPGFAFYENAVIDINGILLKSDKHKPNCFAGPETMLAEAGKSYELKAKITWDSAGKKVISELSAKTSIPKNFKIERAYDLEGNEFKEKETILYLPPPDDIKAGHFVSKKYSDDVAGVLVTMVYGDDVYWGENFIDQLMDKFGSTTPDTARHAAFGDRKHIWTALNLKVADVANEMDSLPLLGMSMPAVGNFKLLFYAFPDEYAKYLLNYYGDGDSRVQPSYNINGGAGIFAGMVVDTFEINVKTLPNVKIYSYKEAQKSYCMQEDHDNKGEYNWKIRSECKEFWSEIPSKEYMSDLITWCEHRNFPIEEYPSCGSAMVRWSKDKKSNILTREVKKWCEEHKDDAECKS